MKLCISCSVVLTSVISLAASIGGTVPSKIGLWSRRVSSSWDGGHTAWNRDVMVGSIGADDWSRCRELGTYAAYAVNAGMWDVLEPVDAAINWRGNSVCTICYVGYMHFTAGERVRFRVTNDRGTNTFILIDDDVGGPIDSSFAGRMLFKKVGECEDAESEYVPQKTGWHAVKFAFGRFYGLVGSQPEKAILFSRGDDPAWRKLIDPGDGSLFRVDPADPLVFTSVSVVNGEVRGVVEAKELIGGYDLFVCTPRDTSLLEFGDWESKSLGAALSVAGESRAVCFRLPPGAKSFRLAAVKRTRSGAVADCCWSAPFASAELAAPAADLPRVAFRSARSESAGEVEVSVYVAHTGSSETCDCEFTFVPEGKGDAVKRTVRGIRGGLQTVPVDGLAAGRAYGCTFRPTAGGRAGEVSAPFSVITAPRVRRYQTGLWQAMAFDGRARIDWGVDVMAAPEGTGAHERTRQLGPAAAFVFMSGAGTGAWENPFDRGTTNRWVSGATFGYEGQVRLRKGQYRFRYNVDDGCRFVLGGREIARTVNNWSHTAVYECPADGWYPLHLEIADITGQAGGNEREKSFLFAYGNDEYAPFADPGDGSLFRCVIESELEPKVAADAPRLAVASVADGAAGSSLTVRSEVLALGGEYADIELRLATKEDMSDAVTAAKARVTATGPVAIKADVRPDTVYRQQLVATAPGGKQDVVPATAVRTEGPSRLTARTGASAVLNAVTFTGEVGHLGVGDSTVYLLVAGDGEQSLKGVDSRKVSETGPFEFKRTFPSLGGFVRYAFVISNACGSVVWGSSTATNAVSLTDKTDYYWNPAVASGKWADRANWTNGDGSPLDERCSYPNSASSRADFGRCGAASEVTLTVADKVTASALSLGPNLRSFALRGEGDGATVELPPKSGIDFPADSRFVLDNVALVSGEMRPARNEKAGSTTIEFSGRSPAWCATAVTAGADEAEGGAAEFVFKVPAGGFARPVISCRGSGDGWTLNGCGGKRLVLSVAPDSPAFDAGESVSTLIEWPSCIEKDNIFLKKSPKAGGSAFFYTYGWENGHTTDRTTPETDYESPTGVKVRFPAQ